LSRYPADKQNDEEVPEALALFTSLLAKLGEKLPAEAIRPKDNVVYDKIMDTLKHICRKDTLTNSRVCIANDLLQFLYGYSTNRAVLGDVKPRVPCRPVLITCMNYKDLEDNTKDGLTIGDILFLVQLAAHRIPNWDGPPDVLASILVICEIGLTVVYRHMEMFVRSPFPSLDPDRASHKKSRNPSASLQTDVARFLHDTLARTIQDACEVNPNLG